MNASGTARPISAAGRGAVERHRRGGGHDPDRQRDRLPEAQLAAQAVRRRVRARSRRLRCHRLSLLGWVHAGAQTRPKVRAPYRIDRSSIGSFAGELTELVQPVAHALGTKQLIDPLGRQRGVELPAGVLAGPGEQREAEEELVDGDERRGGVAGRVGERDLEVLAAAQETAAPWRGCRRRRARRSGSPRWRRSRWRPGRAPCSARRGRASARPATPGGRRGT